jgi:hypothetical protein
MTEEPKHDYLNHQEQEHEIQVITMELANKWVPIFISLVLLAGTVTAVLVNNEHRLSAVEVQTQYIIKTLERLVDEVEHQRREAPHGIIKDEQAPSTHP